MERIKLKDKYFVKHIDNSEILQYVKNIAKLLNNDYKDDVPIFLAVLNGSFMFAADLLKQIDGLCELTFIRVSSYCGTESTGCVKNFIGLNKELKNRRVVVLEDIVDSGTTSSYLMEEIKKYKPKDVRIATLLFKPYALQTNKEPNYVGVEIPNDFIVGYGLDYEGYGRNLKDIYKICDNNN